MTAPAKPIGAVRRTDRRRTAPKAGYLLLLVLALPLSHWPALDLAGARLSFAPIFYLLGLRLWGLGPGLLAALLLAAPHSDTPAAWGGALFAVGQVLFLWRLRRREMLLAETAALYLLLTLPAAGLLMPQLQDLSQGMLVMTLIQFPLAHFLLAAIADVFLQNFELSPGSLLPAPRRSRSLDGSLRAMINCVVAILFSAALFNQADALRRLEYGYRAQIHSFVQHMPPPAAGARPVDRIVPIDLYDGARFTIFVSGRPDNFAARAARALPACDRFIMADRRAFNLANILSWSNNCEIAVIRHAGGVYRVASPLSQTLDDSYWWASGELAILLLAALFALAYRCGRRWRAASRRSTGSASPRSPCPRARPFASSTRRCAAS